MGCIYVIDGIEYNEAQLKEYLAKNLEDFSKELTGEESKARGINKAANEIRRQLLGMESYDPDVITNYEANQKAEDLLKEGYDVNKMLDDLEKGKPVSLVEQEMIKILNMELDAKIAENPTDELLAEQRRLVQINDQIGSEPARLLQARKGMPEPMTTISDYYIDKMNRNGVDVLTEAQKKEAKADFEEKQKADKEIEELRGKVNDYAAKELTQREINETSKAPRKKKNYAAERSKVIDNIKQKLKDIRQGRNGVTAVPLPGVQELIEIAPDVAKLARLFVEEGVEKLEDVVSKVHDILKSEIAGLSKKDVHDMIAGKYSKPRETKSELQIKLEALKKEAKLINEIEEVKAGKPKTEREEIKKNQRIADLNKQLLQAKKDAGYYDQKRLESSVTRVENNITELERRLSEGDYSEKPKKLNILEDRELMKKNPELYNKYLDAIDKRDALLHEYETKMAIEEINSKKGFEKAAAVAGKFTKEGFNTVKALKAGIDNSVVFIQNGLAVLNPMNIKATIEGLKAQLDVFASEKNFRRRLIQIFENKPLMDMVTRSGLDIIDPKGFRESLTNEQFGGSNWLDKLKIKIKGKEYKASMISSPFERIFAAFSNEFRLQIFLRGAEELMAKGKTLDKNLDDFKSLASYANNITGRGKLHPFIRGGNAEKAISTFIWAPSLMSSSLNTMFLGDLISYADPRSYRPKGTGKVEYRGYYRSMTPEVREYAVKQTAAALAMGALVMGAMALDKDKEVDSDPTSVTFGQVKDTKNGWSYNIFGRFTPYIRYLAMMTLRNKMINGKPVKFDAKAETYKFFRGKAAPLIGVGTDLAFSENFQGKKYSLDDKGQIASDLFEPLFINELRQQMKIDGTDAILTRGIPSFMGIKVVNEKMYDKRDLESLLKDTQDSESMDKSLMMTYKDEGIPVGRYITKDEFKEFVKQRDELVGKYITIIHDKGVPVLEGEKVVIKPIEEVSKEDLMKEVNRLKTLATKKIKQSLFGEKPEPEEYLQDDLKFTREDLGIGNPDQEQ